MLCLELDKISTFLMYSSMNFSLYLYFSAFLRNRIVFLLFIFVCFFHLASMNTYLFDYSVCDFSKPIPSARRGHRLLKYNV